MEDMRKTQHEIALISEALSELNSPGAELERLRGAYDEALSQLRDVADIRASINESENIIREESESIRGALLELGLETDVDVHNAVKTIKHEIERLGNPGKRESELKGQLTAKRNMLSELEDLENELEVEYKRQGEILAFLESLSEVPARINTLKDLMNELEESYRQYLSLLPTAKRYEQDLDEHLKLSLEISKIESMIDDEWQKYEEILSHYQDEEHYELIKTKKELDEILRTLDEHIRTIERGMEKAMSEKEELEDVIERASEMERNLNSRKGFLEFVSFVRETLKKASSMVVERVVREVGEEANEIFCETLGTYSQRLIWSSEPESIYDVFVEEGGELRSFKQLSGGEQITASISLRLALLKLLADTDFVFLDEPTVNLDSMRRENLSTQIMNVKGFRQIFVITHDDSFSDKYDNVIYIEKSDGVSRVVR
ncbi:hypothetical protein DRN72_00375 [Methanosarcinales archaeon]|nr:MAG: hypothetical protein DRN72_00375 [Methanosarcinales archaeon]